MPNYKMKPTLNGEGGSTVVANPELVGDEPNLEGLEVEGVKYKVPQGGGTKYKHTIDCKITAGSLCYPVSFRVEIINDNDDAFTTTTLRNFLSNLANNYPCLINTDDSNIGMFDYISAFREDEIYFNNMSASYSISDITITTQVEIPF